MFDSVEATHEISKAEYDAAEPKLRGELIDAQFDLLEAGTNSVVALILGMDVLGRSASAKQLMSWMDPRHIRAFAMVRPSDEERDRPRMWRYWRALPRKGRIGIFLSSWYEGPLSDRFMGRLDKAQYMARVDEICRFEEMLAHEGVQLLKFLFLMPPKQNLKVMKKLAKGGAAAWKVSDLEMETMKAYYKHNDRMLELAEELVGRTSTVHAPWIPVACADRRYRDLTVGRTVRDAIRGCLKGVSVAKPKADPDEWVPRTDINVLSTLDLSQSLERDDYKAQLKKEQKRLTKLVLGKKFENRALVTVFEGNDAAGKGGNIRRVVQALDPRMTRIIPIAAPSDEEKAQPYLWRFWRHIPPQGHVTIFDRSWYGRVLVERVEKFAAKPDWMRAYGEIRSFEQELADYGIIVMKFWLAVDKKEQYRRFKEREKVGYKRYKITEEDWRNRRKWNSYAKAVHDMVERTSTKNAPWTLIEANDKLFARIKVLKTINDRLEAEL